MSIPKSLQNFSKISRLPKRPLEVRRVFQFGSFRLNEDERILLCDDRPVTLKSKDFDVLLVLIKNGPQLVTKTQLLDAVWPNAFVDEANLGVHIAELRKALRCHSTNQIYIQTVHKHGYRFIGQVKLIEEPDHVCAAVAPKLVRDNDGIDYSTIPASQCG